MKAYFDSIPHDKLMQLLEKRISDQRFLELIRKALKAGYMVSNVRETDIIGTPQGSVVSPILANIFLHELDVYVEQLKNAFDAPNTGTRVRSKESNCYRYQVQKAKKIEDPILREKEVRKYANLLRKADNKTVGPLTRKIMFVRYADD